MTHDTPPALNASAHPDEPVWALRGIPIRENGEPLVDLAAGAPSVLWAPRHPVFEYRRYPVGRESLVRKLQAAAERLPAGLRLVVVECWRPPAIQEQMHQATRQRLLREHPDWSPERLTEEAERFSAPMDPHVPPPHTTGGAVDLHLMDDAGELLEFVAPYDLMDPRGAPAFAEGLTATAARNREILREALLPTGLTNYPSEWWHWSYGDQAWAYRGGHPHALYGATQPPGLETATFEFQPHEKPGWAG